LYYNKKKSSKKLAEEEGCTQKLCSSKDTFHPKTHNCIKKTRVQNRCRHVEGMRGKKRDGKLYQAMRFIMHKATISNLQ